MTLTPYMVLLAGSYAVRDEEARRTAPHCTHRTAARRAAPLRSAPLLSLALPQAGARAADTPPRLAPQIAVRSSAMIEAEVLGVLSKGEQFEVLAVAERRRSIWLRVSNGWLSRLARSPPPPPPQRASLPG